jgi:hypothetical protein
MDVATRDKNICCCEQGAVFGVVQLGESVAGKYENRESGYSNRISDRP